MDVRLPDGTMIQNVPDGTTKAALVEKLKANGYDTSGLGVEQPEPFKIGAEGLPSAIQQVAESYGPASKFAIGASGAINDMAMRLKQLLGRNLTAQDIQGIREYRALKQASPSAVAGDIGMSVLSTVAPATAVQSGLTNLAAKAVPAFLAPTVGAAATGAGLSAGTIPVLEGESTGENAAMGAIGGALGDVAARGLSRVIQPIRQSPDVQKLLSEGIVPTPGQAAGSKSFVGRFEQRLESLPILGDIITKGRTRSIEELNRAAVNASLPDQAKINVVGRKAIEEAKGIFDDAYRGALAGKEIPIDPSNINKAISAVKSDPDVFLTKEAEANLDKLAEQLTRRLPSSGQKLPTWTEFIGQRMGQYMKSEGGHAGAMKRISQEWGEAQSAATTKQAGKISGEAAKAADSWLGGIAATHNRSPNAADREFGSAVLGLQKAFRSEIADVIPELKAIDSKYASFLRIQRAAGATGSRQGIFSPEALQSAVRAMDKSRGGFASGKSLMQDLSDPAVEILGRSVADSGTAGRALVGVGLLGAGGMANEYYGGPGYLTALAAAPLLYSRAGSRYMVGNYPGQQSLAELARSIAPYSAQLGRAATNP